MIVLNLLPEGYKTVVRVERVNLSVRTHLMTFLIILILASTPLFWARIYLSKKYEALNAQQQELLRNTQNFNNEVQVINERIDNLARVQDSFKVITEPLGAITKAIPRSVMITSMVFDTKNKAVALHGVARNRDELLALQEHLKTLLGINKVDIPLSDLLENENIVFTLQVTLIL